MEATRTKRRSRDEWLLLINDCRRSGLSDAEWCRRHYFCGSIFDYPDYSFLILVLCFMFGFDMRSSNAWERFRKEHHINRKVSRQIWNSLVGYIRIRGYADDESEKLETDRFVAGVLEENDVQSINGSQIRELTEYFFGNDDLNSFHESLMGILTYLLCIFDMMRVVFNDVWGTEFKTYICGIVATESLSNFISAELDNVLVGIPYFMALVIWLILESCLRGSKNQRIVLYLNRHTAILSVFLLFIFYLAGILVVYQGFYDAVLLHGMSFSFLDVSMSLGDVDFMNMLILIVRVTLIFLMATYPVYLMIHYRKIDREAEKQARRIQKRNGVYQKVLFRIHLN